MDRSASFLARQLSGHMAPESALREERGKSLGVKSIGPWLSFIFVINQIYGPGVLAIPLVYEQSGWFLTLLMVTFFLLVSSLAATCLAQAIASIPDNRQFQQRVEFGTAFEYFYGHRWHVAFQICLNITVQAYNIASVVICAQSIDQAFVAMAGRTYAFEFGPNFGFHEFDHVDALYSSNHVTISIGYALIMLLFLPAGFLNLNDNVQTVQVGSFIFLVVLMAELVGFFIWRGQHEGFHSLPAFGTSFPQIVSVFIFSWAYVIFVPSWLNEKSVDTSVNKVIWSAGIASWVGYVAIGMLCASVFSGSDIALDNMLVQLSKEKMPIVTRVTAHLFSLGVIAPGIPVCSVTTRYNLYVGGICGKKQSYFWGCIAPWLVGFIFCQGEVFANLLNWTSLLFNGLVNFLVPFVMYATSLRMTHTGGAPGPAGLDSDILGPLGINDDAEAGGGVVASTPQRRQLRAAPGMQQSQLQEPLLTQEVPVLPVPSPSPAPPMIVTPTAEFIALGQRSDDAEDGEARSPHFCSPIADPNFMHGPVYPFPKSMRAYSYQIVIGIIVVTQLVITAQIIGDIYYAAIGQDVLD